MEGQDQQQSSEIKLGSPLPLDLTWTLANPRGTFQKHFIALWLLTAPTITLCLHTLVTQVYLSQRIKGGPPQPSLAGIGWPVETVDPWFLSPGPSPRDACLS